MLQGRAVLVLIRDPGADCATNYHGFKNIELYTLEVYSNANLSIFRKLNGLSGCE